MAKHIGETALTKLCELIDEKVNYLKGLINNKAEASSLSKVATSGSYNDLSNKPTIPSSLPANGGNADTVDGKHIVISSSAPTIDDTNIITIVI